MWRSSSGLVEDDSVSSMSLLTVAWTVTLGGSSEPGFMEIMLLRGDDPALARDRLSTEPRRLGFRLVVRCIGVLNFLVCRKERRKRYFRDKAGLARVTQ